MKSLTRFSVPLHLKPQYYVWLKDENDKGEDVDGSEKQWIIIKATASKKVLLSFVDIELKQNIYRLKDIADIRKLNIHGMNKNSKKSPPREIGNESQVTAVR